MTTWSNSFDMMTRVAVCYTRGNWDMERVPYRGVGAERRHLPINLVVMTR